MHNARLVTDLVIATGRFSRAIRRTAQAAESWSAWRALSIVAAHARATVGLVAQLYGCSQPAATKIIGRLDAAGLISRTPDPLDARSSLLHLTEAGQARLEAERSQAVRRMGPVVDELTDEDRRALSRAVELMDSMTEGLMKSA